MPITRFRLISPCVLALAALVVFLGLSANADAKRLKPPGNQIFFGVTDTGDAGGYRSFARAVGKRPAVVQTFHAWGNSWSKSLPRWRSIRARPMLHITTKDDYGNELITPRQIARGRGDDYLLRLNRVTARNGLRMYIRPMGEPNRCLNPYAGVDCAGNVRGGSYSFKWYRQAFRRIAIIVRGGGTRARINARLKRIGLEKVRKVSNRKRLPRVLPKAPVSMVWSPLPAGSPTVKNNWPAKYWPGGTWVDWVATDFYSRYNNWNHLKRFYVKWAIGKNRPMALTEWGLWGEDRPAFVNRIFRYVRTRSRVRMMIYYQDFGSSNAFRIQGHPRSLNAVRARLRSAVFPRFAPRYPRKGDRRSSAGIRR
jgi:hypothetical protein